jgi:hypothetical protein
MGLPLKASPLVRFTQPRRRARRPLLRCNLHPCIHAPLLRSTTTPRPSPILDVIEIRHHRPVLVPVRQSQNIHGWQHWRRRRWCKRAPPIRSRARWRQRAPFGYRLKPSSIHCQGLRGFGFFPFPALARIQQTPKEQAKRGRWFCNHQRYFRTIQGNRPVRTSTRRHHTTISNAYTPKPNKANAVDTNGLTASTTTVLAASMPASSARFVTSAIAPARRLCMPRAYTAPPVAIALASARD